MADPGSATAGKGFSAFVDLIARLRAPGGCPWDREQTHESLKAVTIEEAYEVLEAIDRGDDEHLAGELGDLLLQVVFHAQIATEAGRFTVSDVIERVAAKMVRRHPHVFAGAKAETAGEVLRNWEAIKQSELAAKGGPKDASMLDSVAAGLPAVMEAFQMATKASRVGFDWPGVPAVLEKLDPSRRAYRWFYSALHTLDIPALMAAPAVRTVLVVALCTGGLVFSLTGVVIGWRRLRMTMH